MIRPSALAIVVALLGSCSSTPVVVPTKNLDRPIDITFVCLAASAADEAGQAVLSGRTMDACHPRNATDPISSIDGVRRFGTFAFIANSGRGEMAVADMDSGRLLDLATATPGYGMLPVGGAPENLTASADGCWVVTANRTTCDFTLVDPSRLLVSSFTSQTVQATPGTGTGDAAHRLVVTAGGRSLRTTVGEIAFLPPTQSTATCEPGIRPRAVATFPGCNMVALLDLSFESATANVLDAFYVRPDLPNGWLAAGSAPVCPEECTDSGNEPAQPPEIDGGAGTDIDGGASTPVAAYLRALALVPDGSRVYVASLNDASVTSFDIGSAGLGNPSRTVLAEKAGGVTRLRLGVDPFATAEVPQPDGSTTKVTGQFLNARGSFLYAFANDGSVRVLDVGGVVPTECDVNILASPDQKSLPCFPVGTPGRRPLASGPGIRIPVFSHPDSPAPLARDLAFVDLRPAENDINYHALSGQFGFLVASNGQVYVLNLAPLGEAQTATNSFREVRDLGKSQKTPIAVMIAPQPLVIQSDQAFATSASFSGLEGPLIQSFSTDKDTTKRWFDYPDPDALVSQRWDVTWEGALPLASRSSGIVRIARTAEFAGEVTDAGADFCESGVQEGDVLMFSGCKQDMECQPDDQFTCQVAVSGARGMCLPKNATDSTEIMQKCANLMGSRMRYEVARATPTSLTLRLKLDEVPKTTLNPCQQDSDCQPDADHGPRATGISNSTGVQTGFQCIEVRPQERRCVKPCEKNSDCRAGHVCEEVAAFLPNVATSLCVEAPPIDTDCFPQPMTAYSVRAGHSFVVTGSSLPRLHTTQVAADGTCQLVPNADPSLVNRIPLSAPQCPDSFLAQAHPEVTDLETGTVKSPEVFVQNLPAQAGFNPCLYRSPQHDGAGTSSGGVRAFFQNPQIRFVLANLETYAGDLLAIHFELQYGFVPQVVQIPSYEVLLTMGTRIVVGPTKTPESPIRKDPDKTIFYPYLYVVDQGATALTPGSKGQVLRINPRAQNNEIVSFDTTYSGSTPFQLQ